MVCIYCRGATQVINSRQQRRHNNIWRRRQCTVCKAIFTTHEQPDLAGGFMVKNHASPRPRPFLRDKLFLSIHACCLHRPGALEEAAELTRTIIAKLQTRPGALISQAEIVHVTTTVLQHFDPVAATFYKAYHPYAPETVTS